MINRKNFFDSIRPLFGTKISQSQVSGMETILKEWEDRNLQDNRWLAYMLATTFHETARTMKPIEEFGKGKGRPYGKKDPQTGQAYYGRGFVQLTWKANYKTMGDLLEINLVNDPSLALELEIATQIMFEGMMKGKSFRGDFTGKSLEQYFSNTVDDPVNARRIINGLDRAVTIAGYHRKFLEAIG
ncbi:MAG: glycoside hydrolase family 19 protein [Chitinophagaceae bacterium]